jgi:ribosomal protein S17
MSPLRGHLKYNFYFQKQNKNLLKNKNINFIINMELKTFDIIKIVEQNPISKLSNTQNNKLIQKFKIILQKMNKKFILCLFILT